MAGLPMIGMAKIQIPDYLDNEDILRRIGPHEVAPSVSGRWGERLSVGLTRALAAALAQRLPDRVITSGTRTGTDSPLPRSLFVVVEDFEISAEGQCLIAARWQMTGPQGHTPSSGERGLFSTTADSPSDSAVAAAIAQLIGQLSEQIARTIRSNARE